MIARFVAVAAGVWLMAAPAVLQYTGTLADDLARTLGPIAASFAFVAVWAVLRPLRWATLPIGLWLVAGPWILGYGTAATVNHTVIGVVLAATAFFGGEGADRFGGGWSSLARPRPGLPGNTEVSARTG